MVHQLEPNHRNEPRSVSERVSLAVYVTRGEGESKCITASMSNVLNAVAIKTLLSLLQLPVPFSFHPSSSLRPSVDLSFTHGVSEKNRSWYRD